MNRAYSLITLKGVDDDQRVIEGTASTPSVDRHGDIVEPLGAEFKLPLPLLWQHRSDEPVGHVEWAKPRADGIPFRARFVKVAEPGPLRDRLETAWQSVKSGLVRACSIGFSPIEAEPLKSGGLRFKRWTWLENSIVTIPANVDATIATAKFYDRSAQKGMAARVVKLDRPVGAAMYHATRDPLDPAIAKTSGSGVAMMANMIAAGAKATDEALAQLDRRLRNVEGRSGRLTDDEMRYFDEMERLMAAGDFAAARRLAEGRP